MKIDKNQIRGIIFDFDGTLLDSLGMWKSLDTDYLITRQIPAPEDLRKAIEGLSFNETARYFKEQFSLDESVEEIVDAWHRHIEDVYPFLPFKKGAKDFLLRRKKEGYPLALATSNSRQLVEKSLAHQGFLGFFPIIVTADDVGRGKPSPDVFLEAAQRLGLKPEECLVFEDTYMGVLGAKRAGMKTVAIFDFHNQGRWEDIEELADYTAQHYEDAEEMFL